MNKILLQSNNFVHDGTLSTLLPRKQIVVKYVIFICGQMAKLSCKQIRNQICDFVEVSQKFKEEFDFVLLL